MSGYSLSSNGACNSHSDGRSTTSKVVFALPPSIGGGVIRVEAAVVVCGAESYQRVSLCEQEGLR